MLGGGLPWHRWPRTASPGPAPSRRPAVAWRARPVSWTLAPAAPAGLVTARSARMRPCRGVPVASGRTFRCAHTSAPRRRGLADALATWLAPGAPHQAPGPMRGMAARVPCRGLRAVIAIAAGSPASGDALGPAPFRAAWCRRTWPSWSRDRCAPPIAVLRPLPPGTARKTTPAPSPGTGIRPAGASPSTVITPRFVSDGQFATALTAYN
jgi:hypothetical protein